MMRRLGSTATALLSSAMVLLIGLCCGPVPLTVHAQDKAPRLPLPAAQRPLLTPTSRTALPLRGLSPQQAESFRRGGLAKYAIIRTAPAGRVATARFSRGNAAILMPDLHGQRLVGLSSDGKPAGIAYASADAFTLVLKGRAGRAIGTVSMHRNGTLSIAVDPDHDGIADYVEEWQGERSQASYVREGLGERFLAALMAGKLPALRGKRVGLILSGGNIDPTVLGRVIDKGLVHDGRLTRFTATVTDRPGGLAALTRIIADSGASIRDIVHERAFSGPEVFAVSAVCTVETRDHAHVRALHHALKKNGFPLRPGR